MSYSRTAAAVLLCSVTLGACADAARPTAPPDIVADASAVACPVRANNSIAKLTACVTLDAVHAHLAALQEIADANGNTRAPATPGFDASADYVAGALTDAGYAVTRQQFSYSSYTVFGANVEQVVPANITYVFGSDFLVMSQSPSADVTAPVTPVDLQLGLGNVSTSGCEAADFAGFPAGNIALIQRGVCTFELKALNAAAAGAVAVIIFNQGNDPSRLGVVGGTLATPTAVTIPVVGTTYDLGVQTAALTPGVVVRVSVNASSGPFTSENILAELPGTPRGQVVMAGAHLDGVTNGPGINDNGSGTAVLLETAIQMARVRPLNTVRFAWWGAHEIGLAGSTHYVTNLTSDELDAIALYLDLHMLASPNFVRFVYDGDGSTFAPAGPDGSGGIEQTLGDLYAARGLAFEPTTLGVSTDFTPFATAGIPVGGMTMGAEGVKTAAQAAVFGGTAGQQFDPCYHQACDTYANVNLQALDENADIAAAAILTFSMTTEAVNGIGGRPNYHRSAVRPAIADR